MHISQLTRDFTGVQVRLAQSDPTKTQSETKVPSHAPAQITSNRTPAFARPGCGEGGMAMQPCQCRTWQHPVRAELSQRT